MYVVKLPRTIRIATPYWVAQRHIGPRDVGKRNKK